MDKSPNTRGYVMNYCFIHGGTQEKPVGLVWIGVATPNGVEARRYHFSGDRSAIRAQTVEACFEFLLERIGS